MKKPNLKKKLWEVFSRYIRQRDNGKCFTCGLQKPWKQMQAGHFICKSIGGLGLYFHEKNVHCQCYRCNINLGGNGAIYVRKLIATYGEDVLKELYHIYDNRNDYKISDEEYLVLIDKYTPKEEKIKKLKTKKKRKK